MELEENPGDPELIGRAFPAPLAGLNGIPTDGGFQAVDEATHPLRIDAGFGVVALDTFMFNAGSIRRFVGETRPATPHAESIWPGGTSGVLGSHSTSSFSTNGWPTRQFRYIWVVKRC